MNPSPTFPAVPSVSNSVETQTTQAVPKMEHGGELRLEVGKFYLDGTGCRLGPVRENQIPQEGYPFRATLVDNLGNEKGDYAFAEDGRFDGRSSDFDLVSEWVDWQALAMEASKHLTFVTRLLLGNPIIGCTAQVDAVREFNAKLKSELAKLEGGQSHES